MTSPAIGRHRPLDRIASIKLKWSIVIVAAVGVTAVTSQVGLILGWPVWLRLALAAGLALGAVELLARGMTSPLREMAAAAAAVRQGDHSHRVTVTTTDEVGQLAEAFNRMAAELAEADRVQKEFVANASHELQAPVAALRANIANLVDRVVDPDPEVLATMLAQVEHLSRLVLQLLDLHRLETLTQPGATGGLVAVGVLLRSVVAEAALLHPGANITLRTSGPLGVVADEAQLHQLFTNLLANALRFGPLGAEVTVEAEGNAEEVRVAVRDLGPGIAPQHQTRVFERFWRADRAEPARGALAPAGGNVGPAGLGGPDPAGGAGLGLSICQRIVEHQGGTIRISANRPQGACVTVTLPPRPATDG